MRLLAWPLLLVVATYRTSAVPLGRESLDPLDLGWEGKDGYYRTNDGLYCQKCPPGTYVAEECKEQNGSGRCEPCGHGEFMEYPNAFRWCQDCSKCREDQVEQSPCQPFRNTVCACRNGTFCPPEHPCEMCQKCQPRCPEGQVVLKPCTPDSDLQCGPAVDTVPLYPWIITMVMVVVFLIMIVFIWKYCCSPPGDGRPSSRGAYEMVSSMFQKLPWWYRKVNAGAEDNAANDHLESQQPRPSEESGNPRESLVPAPGQDPGDALKDSFYIFAEKVPLPSWMRFGRRLGLGENDVLTATSDEGFYQMLYKWLNKNGARASVNTLLQTLKAMQLVGVAEEISSTLVRNGVFQYETS